MERKNFAQVLKAAKIDYKREYRRLYDMFYESEINQEKNVLRDACATNFWNMPIRGTCLSLDDFDDYYEIKFEKEPEDFDLNYLLNFCEYTYNLVMYTTFSTWGYGIGVVYYQRLSKTAKLSGSLRAAASGFCCGVCGEDGE